MKSIQDNYGLINFHDYELLIPTVGRVAYVLFHLGTCATV